jgi:hypothetical protein
VDRILRVKYWMGKGCTERENHRQERWMKKERDAERRGKRLQRLAEGFFWVQMSACV